MVGLNDIEELPSPVVFVYRMVCRDTVKPKIVNLQQQKRELAAVILNADDLKFLLS